MRLLHRLSIAHYLLLCVLFVLAGCSQSQTESPAVKSSSTDRRSEQAAPAEEDLSSPAQAHAEKPDSIEENGSSKNVSSTGVPGGLAEHPAEEKSSSQEGDSQEGTVGVQEPGTDKNPPHSKTAEEIQSKLFDSWATPQAALLISGQQWGYIEPCGCAGLENQKGGLKRRHSLVKHLREKSWPLAPLELGGIVKRSGPQAEIKYGVTLDALATIGYAAVSFGPQDLQLPADRILGVAANLGQNNNPFVVANVGLFGFDNGFIARSKIIPVGKKKIGVTAVLGESYQKQVRSDNVLTEAAAVAIKKVVGKLAQEADILVLLAHATPEESKQLAREFPQFDVVVTAEGSPEPSREVQTIEHSDGKKTQFIEVGHKGTHVAVLAFYDQQTEPVRYARVGLDASFPDSNAMKEMLVKYQSELKTVGLRGLGATPNIAHPSGQKFAGSESCGDCHSSAHAVWNETPHHHATQTLVDLNPPRHHDPECLSCHVTGWEPQKYFAFTSGFQSIEQTPLLRANGCENCHGPAAQHVAVENGDIEVTEEEAEKLRKALRLTLLPGEREGKVIGKATRNCLGCHDLDNSPDFDFKTYWPQVAHPGKD